MATTPSQKPIPENPQNVPVTKKGLSKINLHFNFHPEFKGKTLSALLNAGITLGVFLAGAYMVWKGYLAIQPQAPDADLFKKEDKPVVLQLPALQLNQIHQRQGQPIQVDAAPNGRDNPFK